MSTITKSKTWADAEAVNFDDMNANFDTLYGAVNGNIDNENVKTGAAIAENKIAFDASGHGHTGGADGKAIPKGFLATIVGTLTTGTSLTPLLVMIGSQTVSKIYLDVKTAPTGADLIVDINKNGTSIWNTTQANRPKILAGATSGTQTSFDTTSFAEGDLITIDVDQVGSTVAGADLTITIK